MITMDVFYNADDIVLLAHTFTGLQQPLNMCTEYGVEYDAKFNDSKLVLVGPRFNSISVPLEFAGKC